MRKQSKGSCGPRARRASQPPIPSRTVMEKMMREIHRVMEGQEFESIEEANAFLATLTGPGLEQALEKAPEPSPQEEAQELAYRAMEAKSRKRALALAQQALAKDPDCVDALITMAAATARTPEDLIAGLAKAVQAGERSLGAEFFEQNKGHFWGLLETRPYMRARQQLADVLLESGRMPEAIAHFEALLALNPSDNQGVRDTLLGCYLASDNLAGARLLLREYEQDASAVFAWGRTLLRFLSGDLKGADRALEEARQQNGFVELYLTGQKIVPRGLPDSYAFGSKEEALICLESTGAAWAAHPKALIWLLNKVGPEWGQDFGAEHEQILTELLSQAAGAGELEGRPGMRVRSPAPQQHQRQNQF
jgi:tetratricopeptide (TPR) repeat protein